MRVILCLLIVLSITSTGYAASFSEEEVGLWRVYYETQSRIGQYEGIVRTLQNDGVEIMGRIKQLRKLRLEDEKKKADQEKVDKAEEDRGDPEPDKGDLKN